MTKKIINKKPTVPLIIEPYPKNYSGYPFITLIQYRKQHILTIVDNSDHEMIAAYVLDLCGPENVSEEMIINIASEWYKNNYTTHPLSIEFSLRGISDLTSKIYRKFSIEYISRVIGPVAFFPLKEIKSVKRRRKKPISTNIEINYQSTKIEEFSK